MGLKFLKLLKGDARLESLMKMPCTALCESSKISLEITERLFSGNWEDILEEISNSNIVQRDNIAFARKLNKDVAKKAKTKESEVIKESITKYPECILNLQAKSYDHLWSPKARRKLLIYILDEWVKNNSKKTTVKKLMSALSLPGFFDVKLRVELLLLKNCPAAA